MENANFYKERFFDRRNWILDNLDKLNLTSSEAIIVLMIDFLNQYQQTITMDILSQKTNLDKKEVDLVINNLITKGFLTVTATDHIVFDIDTIFVNKNAMMQDNNIFDLFESELGKALGRKDLEKISEWTRIYDNATIVKALRKAVVNEKYSVAYVEKILQGGNNE